MWTGTPYNVNTEHKCIYWSISQLHIQTRIQKETEKSIVKVQSPVSIPPQQAKNQTRPMEKLCSNKNDLKFETF